MGRQRWVQAICLPAGIAVLVVAAVALISAGGTRAGTTTTTTRAVAGTRVSTTTVEPSHTGLMSSKTVVLALLALGGVFILTSAFPDRVPRVAGPGFSIGFEEATRTIKDVVTAAPSALREDPERLSEAVEAVLRRRVADSLDAGHLGDAARERIVRDVLRDFEEEP